VAGKNGSRKLKCCWELQKFVACHCHFCFAPRGCDGGAFVRFIPGQSREFKADGTKSNNQTQSRERERDWGPGTGTPSWGLFQPLKFRSYCQILVLPVMQIPGTT